ncbi:hypothetical protein [Rhizobium sp. BG4]|uniref:hypothetical protein n=1 Tax=Rhizobium sp. BG4 TaxID=2613770 RepID=UPI001FEE9AAC|nr:hypothetical protein [Rhizobium sp. BG4]
MPEEGRIRHFLIAVQVVTEGGEQDRGEIVSGFQRHGIDGADSAVAAMTSANCL